MNEIPAEILDVAAVVTGAERLPLTGWQRTQAIRAMHALGRSRDWSARQLCVEPKYLMEQARRAGVSFHDPNPEPDWLAIQFVCDGTPIRLMGVDRDEAIRRLARRGKTSVEIARLLRTEQNVVNDRACRIGVTLPPARTCSIYPCRQPVAA